MSLPSMRATDIQSLVRRLLTLEAAESQDQTSVIEAAERVADKLRRHLSSRIGQEGFRTLLARALALTSVQFPHLSVVRVEANGSLAGLRQTVPQPPENGNSETSADAAAGAEALLAHLLGLLVTFIGEDLTRRILSVLWPEIASDDSTDGEKERP